jgi:hypothetical protein
MSQYLSRYYCGNKEGLCNFSEPIKYDQMIDRQFDNLSVDIVSECSGEGQDKGFCCYKNKESDKLITTNDLEKINQMANGEVFKRDENGNVFKGQIPLIKLNKDGEEIKSIDVCDCGGDNKDYKKCVKKNCKDYKHPTKYEYCKMGDMSNLYGCYGKNQENCNVGNADPEAGFMYSPNLRINNLFPDCYLNLCNKSQINGELDNTSSFSNETQYHIFDNNVNSQYNNGIDNYLLNKDIEPPLKETKNNNNIISISKVLFE